MPVSSLPVSSLPVSSLPVFLVRCFFLCKLRALFFLMPKYLYAK
jgi:hypothetical protein